MKSIGDGMGTDCIMASPNRSAIEIGITAMVYLGPSYASTGSWAKAVKLTGNGLTGKVPPTQLLETPVPDQASFRQPQTSQIAL